MPIKQGFLLQKFVFPRPQQTGTIWIMEAGNVKGLDCFVSTFIRLPSNSFQNTVDIKFVTRLRMGLCHLPVYIFKHHFQDTLNLQCNCGMDVKSCTHFLLQSPFLINKRCTLISNLIKVDTQRSKLTLPALHQIP